MRRIDAIRWRRPDGRSTGRHDVHGVDDQCGFAAGTFITTTEGLTAVISDMGGILGLAVGTSGFLGPEPTCFDESFAALTPAGRQAFAGLREDPLTWTGVDRDDAKLLFSAYFDCVDPSQLRDFIALAVLKMNHRQQPCVSAAWKDLLTSEPVASSIAYGHGLDDLAPESSPNSPRRPRRVPLIASGGSTTWPSTSRG